MSAALKGHTECVIASTPIEADTNPQNVGERQINMLRGSPNLEAQLIPYDTIELNVGEAPEATTVPVDRAARREGRRRMRRDGRRRQRRRRDRQRRQQQPAIVAPARPAGRWIGTGIDAFWQPYY